MNHSKYGNEPIDIVIPWVDVRDPQWQKNGGLSKWG